MTAAGPTIHELAFQLSLSLPSPLPTSHQAGLATEIRDKFALDGSCAVEEIGLDVDSFDGRILSGNARFEQEMCRDRARVVVKQNPRMTHYGDGEETVECSLEMVEEELDPDEQTSIRVEPLSSHVDAISLFNTFHHPTLHPIYSLCLSSIPSRDAPGTFVWSATVVFASSSTPTFDPAQVYDPYTILFCPENGAEEDDFALEERVRALWPGAVEVRVVGEGEERRVLVRGGGVEKWETEGEEGEVRDWPGGMKGERMTLSPPGGELKIVDPPPEATDMDVDLPPVEDSSIRSTLMETFQPSSPPAVRPQTSPSPEPSTSSPNHTATADPAPEASSSLTRKLSASSPPAEPQLTPPPPARKRSSSPPASTSAPRPAWMSTLKPYPFPVAPLRPPRAHELVVKYSQDYSVCELPAGDAERRRDFMLAHGGQDWPDFSSESFPSRTSISNRKARDARWDQDRIKLHATTTAAKASELVALETLWASTDVPKPEWELTDQERRAIEASLVDMALGLERQQTHDDMLLMAVRNRENAGQRTDKLIELAHVGIAKTPKVVDPRGRK